MNYKIFWPTLGSLLIVAIFAGHEWETSGTRKTLVTYDHSGDFNSDPVPQRSSTRIIHKINSKSLWKAGADSHLKGPISLKIAPDESLLVMDYGDMSVKELSPSGQLIKTYPTPSTLRSLTDIGFPNNDEIWVADNTSRAIYVCGRRSNNCRTVNLSQGPYRISPKTGGFVAMASYPSRLAFFETSPNNNHDFGRIISNQDATLLALDGWIEPTAGQGFLFFSQYMGVFALYNDSGKPAYLRASMSTTTPPTVLSNSKGLHWVDREAPLQALNIRTDKENLTVFALAYLNLKKAGIIDHYSLKDGNYLYSTPLPSACEQALQSGPHIYTVNGSEITKWEITELVS